MSKTKDLIFDVMELLEAGLWPAEIVKRLPVNMEFVLSVEDEMFANDPRNIGPDYDQE